jgi:hypothetical protein
MALFKPKAFPVVIEDITRSLHRASCNAATATALLHDLVRRAPPNVGIDGVVVALSRDVFRLREECYPTKEIGRLLKQNRLVNHEKRGHAYWPIYTYLFSLIPAVVEQPRVGGSRWSANEYRQLQVACYSHWCKAHDKKCDTAIMAGYNRVRAATTAWFRRSSKLAAALESCASETIDHILLSFPCQDGSVREKGFRFAIEELIDSLYTAFKADLAQYYLGAGGFGFFASDPTPLPSHVDRESGWP